MQTRNLKVTRYLQVSLKRENLYVEEWAGQLLQRQGLWSKPPVAKHRGEKDPRERWACLKDFCPTPSSQSSFGRPASFLLSNGSAVCQAEGVTLISGLSCDKSGTKIF